MITLLLMAQALSVPAQEQSDLVALSAIVAPYAQCEFGHRSKLEAAQKEWLPAAQQQHADPSNKSAAEKADRLMKNLAAVRQNIQTECGYERIHKELQEQILALQPEKSEAGAFWMARSVFHALNNLNEGIVKLKAGVLPPMPVGPPPPPAPPGLRRPVSDK